ncbi:GTP pyrophosphokinase ywaC [Neisseria zoodegmatis]|uniref:GTP pyrophosphokinase ywaC n=1 Tax=Neisseria zoodegmatis TaxID=326523 RepID=A0A378WVY4_9NEIS|nr:(p)ppGpp synthetase [Neisseria zoodegmatis]SUA44483.1 GTP pyrophosphokinase ywaC [Neisseria zoodegmatis]
MSSLDFEMEKDRFRKFYDDNLDVHRERVEIVIQLLKAILDNKFSKKVTVLGRLKDREESIQKFSRKYQSDLESKKQPYQIKDHITDLYGLRVICSYEDEVNEISEILSKEFHVIEVTNKVKQIESQSNLFGYKGIHLDIGLDESRLSMVEYSRCNGQRFEIQIRTITQDAWSTIDHLINYKKDIPLDLKRRVMTLAALFELADHEFLSIRDKTDEHLKSVKELLNCSKSEVVNLQLDALILQAFFEKEYPEYQGFNSYKVEGFLKEIKELSGEQVITIQKLNEILIQHKDTLKKYETYLAENKGVESLNPFTELRHFLYLSDKSNFSKILHDFQRDNFDGWLREQ